MKVLIEVTNEVAPKLHSHYWLDWQKAPNQLLLIEDDREFLFFSQSADTTFHDNCEGNPSRLRTLNKQFLATFPLVNQKPTIVIGTPANTGKTKLEWVITILHEHFHQLQFSHPKYYSALTALALDKGDKNGLWMLNHPFPYKDSVVNLIVKEMSRNLALLNTEKSKKMALKDHIRLKKALNEMLSEADYRYFNLQLWQEGMARYMEILLVGDWIKNFERIPQNNFTKMELENVRKKYEWELLDDLLNSCLRDQNRSYFYSLGAAEA